MITLYKFNPNTNDWTPQRLCEDSEAQEWLRIYEIHEPGEIFCLSSVNPSQKQEIKLI
jgi:hypothetical protein